MNRLDVAIYHAITSTSSYVYKKNKMLTNNIELTSDNHFRYVLTMRGILHIVLSMLTLVYYDGENVIRSNHFYVWSWNTFLFKLFWFYEITYTFDFHARAVKYKVLKQAFPNSPAREK